MHDLPFRAIAIVGSEREIDDAIDSVATQPAWRLGLMLRDRGHDPERTALLVEYLLSRGLSSWITPIANSLIVDGIPFTHITSAGFERATAPSAVPSGYSVHSLAEAVRAEELGARYLLASPIFPTTSKPGHPGIGLDMLRKISARVTAPVFALGGVIDASRARACIEAGAYGIASISLFTSSTSAREERARIFQLLENL